MRIEYIDKLKAFAILLVVMGHVVEKGFLINDTAFNAFYGSFHMPLFMFLSGMFAFKSFKSFNLSEYVTFFRKKAVRILWPFAVIGSLYVFLSNNNNEKPFMDAIGGFWFLPALFYCMIIGSVAFYIKQKICHGKFIGALIVDLCMCRIVFAAYILKVTGGIPFYLSFAKMLPFFLMGGYNLYPVVRENITNNNKLYSICILIYLLLLAQPYKMPINVQGFFAIIILLNLFSHYDAKIPKVLSIIGKYSLEIYVFHYFMLPSLSQYRSFFMQPNTKVLDNGNFILLFVVSSIIAPFIIAACLIVTKIIRRGKITSFICFGE